MPTLPTYNPLQRKATRDEINESFNYFESSPISVGGVFYDCDDVSLLRMRDTLSYWHNLANEDNKISWVTADNTVVNLTQDMLSLVITELSEQRVVRRARLFRRLQELKQNNTVTARELNNASLWGLTNTGNLHGHN